MRKSTRIQLLVVVLVLVIALSACTSGGKTMYDYPIGWEGGWAPVQWLVTQLAQFLYWISMNLGEYYWVGLVVLTLIVRTVGWPIYAKSNQTTSNMQMAQPELNRLQEKFKGRTDEVSQRKMQAEQMEIYKKYGINPLGCLLPFAQMPIFIAMYQVVRRVPLSIGVAAGTADYSALKLNFLWIKDLGKGDPYYILPILVVALMFFYQKYSMKKPEYLNNKKYEKSATQSQTEQTMKIMMYMMPLMLGWIAIGNAGIALYWVIGNAYQFLQTYVNRKQTAKKFLELKE